jgi:hypothetical protein
VSFLLHTSPLLEEERHFCPSTLVTDISDPFRFHWPSAGPEYVLPFRFKDEHGSRTTHHLIFVSKGFKGYEIMKEIMVKESSDADQGVASFGYNPMDVRGAAQQQLLFQLSRPLDDLGDMLLKEFARGPC